MLTSDPGLRAGSELVPRVHMVQHPKAVDVWEDIVGFHMTDFEPRFPMFAGPPDGVDPVGFIARSLKRTEVGVSRIVDSAADRDGEAGGDVAVELTETADGVYGLVVKGIEALSDSGVVGSDCFADECFALKSPASELQVHFRNHSPGG